MTKFHYIVIGLLGIGLSLLAYLIFDAKQTIPGPKSTITVNGKGEDGKETKQELTYEQALIILQGDYSKKIDELTKNLVIKFQDIDKKISDISNTSVIPPE